MEKPEKSRDLSLSDFYTILQQEYISYLVRSRIYPAEYANKYVNYCVCKKDKIEKISSKNGLPSIFNSESVKGQFIEQFINQFGLPNFQYRDELSIKIMGKWDKVYWFRDGVSIKAKTDTSIIITTVVKNLFSSETVVANVGKETRQFQYGFISRIISESLFLF